MDERTLISKYFAGRQGSRPDVLLGIGDDAAVLRCESGWDLVVATDSIAEGTHFPAGIPARAIGHRCLAVNLSDLAAMAAEPLWCSLALSLPKAEPLWMEEFAAGLFALADRSGIALIGGDTVRGPLAATVTVQGRVRPGAAVTRTGARAGDGIWVTGHPGDAVAGRLLLDVAGQVSATVREPLCQRFLYPEPRLREGSALAAVATAMLDVSDGLHDDIDKLMVASGMGAELDAGLLPLSAELRTAAADRAIEYALTGGDDYELCFTVPERATARLRAIAADWAVPVTRIGTVVSEPGVRWQYQGRPLQVPDSTFRHF
ncbi:MAG: thiamine-phosphate kinase [Chromatiales bacterium]|nr:thiamine-phosphate kinase [Chromatiales bacterium]